jgi:hypothetical protein
MSQNTVGLVVTAVGSAKYVLLEGQCAINVETSHMRNVLMYISLFLHIYKTAVWWLMIISVAVFSCYHIHDETAGTGVTSDF